MKESATLAKQLRTPMNAVLGFTHLLRKTPLTPQQAEYLSQIELAARSISHTLGWDSDAVRHPNPAPGAILDDVNLRTKRVLVVEDNKINQQVLVSLLDHQQMKSTLAENGVEALASLDRQVFDLVMMDLQMPLMDGMETTRHIRRRYSKEELPVVAVTTLASPEQRTACLAAGMNDFLAKPIEPDELLRVLCECLKSKASLTQTKSEPASTSPVELQVPGIDMETLLRRFRGNTKIIRELLGMFSREFPEHPQKLREALAAGDRELAIRLVHTSKGVGGNLAALRVSKISATLEEMLKREGEISSPELYTEYELALREVIDGVAALSGLAGSQTRSESSESGESSESRLGGFPT